MSSKSIHPLQLVSMLTYDKESIERACKLWRSIIRFEPKTIITFNKMGQDYGDLGNQMFQAAMIVATAKLHEIHPKIPNPSSKHYKEKGVKLGCFSMPSEILLDTPLDNAQILDEGSFNLRSVQLGCTLAKLLGQNILPNKDISLEGFFQYWQLLKFAEEELRGLFSFTSEISKKANLVLDQIKTNYPKRAIIGTHVRLGDQVGDELNHPILPIEYYQTAFKRCKEYYKNPIFLIVSDEPQKSKNIYFGDDVIYADQLGLVDSIDTFKRTHLDTDSIFSAPVDMCILSKCDSVVIANSTFSWWAAWLNKSGKIYVPIRNKWFGDLLNFKNMSDFYPPEWEEIWFQSMENTKLTFQNFIRKE